MEKEDIGKRIAELTAKLKTADSVETHRILSQIDDLEWQKSGKPRRKPTVELTHKTNSGVIHHTEKPRMRRGPR